MDKIVIEGMRFYGFHGVLPEEKQHGQEFIINIVLKLDLQRAAITDDLNQTVDYATVFGRIKEIVEQQRFNLIEALSLRISDMIFEEFFQVEEVGVLVKKPQAPIKGNFDFVAVEILRRRK